MAAPTHEEERIERIVELRLRPLWDEIKQLRRDLNWMQDKLARVKTDYPDPKTQNPYQAKRIYKNRGDY